MIKINLLSAALLIIFIAGKPSFAQPLQHVAINKATDDNQFVVSLFSNGYAYPQQGDDAVENITPAGITGWSNTSEYFKTFFYPQHDGNIDVAVKLKSPEGDCQLEFMLDSSGKKYNVTVKQSAGFITIPIGSFVINKACYHCIQIKGISKAGINFPEVESLIISGPAAKDLKYNLSEYKGAPSTHLWYAYPKDSSVAWWYDEVTVPPGVNAANAYYMTNGFNGGYMGIQLNSPTERRIIFSIWSNYSTNDPKEIPADYAVTLVKKGKDVFTGEFGNEGSGGHSHLTFMWKQGVTYKLLVGAKANGDHTIYTAYYYAPENASWRLIAQWDKTKTKGELLGGLYSFVENFGANGNDFFKADYGNQWICTAAGTWIELTKCSLTTTASPAKHQRYDYGAGVENNKFYMFTGGFKEMNNMAPHTSVERKANGGAPPVDLSALPGI